MTGAASKIKSNVCNCARIFYNYLATQTIKTKRYHVFDFSYPRSTILSFNTRRDGLLSYYAPESEGLER